MQISLTACINDALHHVMGFQIIEFLPTFAKFLQLYTRGLSYSLIILVCFTILKTFNPQWRPPSLNDYCQNGGSPVGDNPMDLILEFQIIKFLQTSANFLFFNPQWRPPCLNDYCQNGDSPVGGWTKKEWTLF